MTVIMTLVIAGPATALDLKLKHISDPTPNQGDSVEFTGTIDLKANEKIPLDSLKIEFEDGTTCEFEVDGTPIGGCEAFEIKPEHVPDYVQGDNVFKFKNQNKSYGYGYGYGGSGKNYFEYKFKLDTTDFEAGQIKFRLIAVVKGDEFASEQHMINVKVEKQDKNDDETEDEHTESHEDENEAEENHGSDHENETGENHGNDHEEENETDDSQGNSGNGNNGNGNSGTNGNSGNNGKGKK